MTQLGCSQGNRLWSTGKSIQVKGEEGQTKRPEREVGGFRIYSKGRAKGISGWAEWGLRKEEAKTVTVLEDVGSAELKDSRLPHTPAHQPQAARRIF